MRDVAVLDRDKPKVLLYAPSLGDGGAERLWACLATALNRQGYPVIFAQDFAADDNRHFLDDDIPLVTLGRNNWQSLRALVKLLRTERPDVALGAVGGSNVKLMLANLITGRRTATILTYHGFDEHKTGLLSYLAFRGLPVLGRLASAVVAGSKGLRDALVRRWGCPDTRAFTLPNPVFYPEHIEVPTAPDLAAREAVILSAGRLVPDKDFPTLIRAFALLKRADAKLIIIGKGPEEARIKAVIADHGLQDRVTLAGYAAEPWAYYARAKCFALSSVSEQFGNVIVEAMAHGLPVVATSCPGPTEILDNGTFGALVKPGDPAAMARAIDAALAAPGDPGQRVARAATYSFHRRLADYEALIDRVAKSGRAPATSLPRAETFTKNRLYIDLTHLGRHVTGIERIAIEQFEQVDFAGADVRHVRAKSVPEMIFKQQIVLPSLALLHRRARFVFPGFPPSLLFAFAKSRATLYVHDTFLITRRAELSTKAKLYMAPAFRVAVARLKNFLVNSEKTARELRPFVSSDADIRLYRPAVRNVFALDARRPPTRPRAPGHLKLVAVGTIEPRKNYAAAVAILEALRRGSFPDATLDIIGRTGWGGEGERIAGHPGVRVHGYVEAARAKAIIEDADVYLCTSHDEGLGLPLLEVQFAGLPVVAPDAPVFREVLGQSGTFIQPGDATASAAVIASIVTATDWPAPASAAALANLARWNGAAASDAARARLMFADPARPSAVTATA